MLPADHADRLVLGAAAQGDVGFAGADWVAELGAEVEEVLDTGLDPVRLEVQADLFRITDVRLHDRLAQGQIPLWNPYNNCGLAYLAQWNTMALYPGSQFCVLLPMPWAHSSRSYLVRGPLWS